MKNYRISPKGKSALCEAVVVLTESQLEKLENSELLPRIEAAAKDLHVDFSVEKNGNVALCIVGTTQKWPVDSTDMHNAEINATNFMSFVDDLEVEEDLKDCDGRISDKDFVKKLWEDINLPIEDKRHVFGALIVDGDCVNTPIIPVGMEWGRMGHNLLREMCELYLKAHEQDN